MRRVLERLLNLLAVHPVAKRPGVRASLGAVARMLTGGSRTALVGVGLMVAAVVLLEDGAGPADGQSHGFQTSLTFP